MVYGDKNRFMDRFCKNFERLSPIAQGRLTVENDDKESMYSVKDWCTYMNVLVSLLYLIITTKVFGNRDLTEQDKLSYQIQGPKVSNQLFIIQNWNYTKVWETKTNRPPDYINELPNLYGNDVDVMVDNVIKELSILPFINSNRCEYSGLLSTQVMNKIKQHLQNI